MELRPFLFKTLRPCDLVSLVRQHALKAFGIVGAHTEDQQALVAAKKG